MKLVLRTIVWVVAFTVGPTYMSMADIRSTGGEIEIDTNSDGSLDVTISVNGIGVNQGSPSANLHVTGNSTVSSELGVGTGTINHSLDLRGSIAYTPEVVSADTSLSGNTFILADNDTAGGNLTLDLPPPSEVEGRTYIIKKNSSNHELDIEAVFSRHESLVLTTSSTGFPYMKLYSGGGNWWITDRSDYFQTDIAFSDNVVAYWKLDEQNVSGNAADSSVNDNFGTYQGTMTDADVVAGVSGNALEFDGSNDVVQMSDDAAFGILDKPFTVMAWVQTTVAADKVQIVGQYNTSPRWALRLEDNSIAGDGPVFYGRNSSAKRAGGSTDVVDGEWHHIAAVITPGGTGIIYVDGQDDTNASDTFDSDLNSTNDLTIGAATGSGYYSGNIDDIRIYDRPLPASVINQIYQFSKP